VRRGLAVERAEVAAVLNIAADHLGEWGCWSLEDLLRAKLAVTRVVAANGLVVLNADDPLLLAAGAELPVPVAWFSLDAGHPALARHRAEDGLVAFVRDDTLLLATGQSEQPLARLSEIPIALGGAARHNVANALAAALIGAALGFGKDALRAGLAEFGRESGDNPGRLALFELGGARAVVDFAHNPHGQEALLDMAARMGAKRRLVVLGQAGDRDDEAIDELVRVTLESAPDHILIKEMERFLRGRAPGEVPARIEAALRAANFPPERFEHVASESAALERALAWARPGDLLLLFVHAEREQTLARLEQLSRAGWSPGPVPPEPAVGD
jgi:cyanophycin synthetase